MPVCTPVEDAFVALPGGLDGLQVALLLGDVAQHPDEAVLGLGAVAQDARAGLAVRQGMAADREAAELPFHRQGDQGAAVPLGGRQGGQLGQQTGEEILLGVVGGDAQQAGGGGVDMDQATVGLGHADGFLDAIEGDAGQAQAPP